MEELKHIETGDGATLAYRIRRGGGDSSRVIVLVHGLASNMTRWSELADNTSLTDAWDLLRVDLRGHGNSLWRGRLDMETWCDDLLQVLDTEGYGQAVIVGHSLGAQIAVYFGSWHPSRTAGLALIDPVVSDALLGHLRLASRFVFLLKALIAVIRLLNTIGIYRRHIPRRDLRELDETMRRELLAEGKVEEMVERYASVRPDIAHFPIANFLQEIVQMVRPLPDLSTVKAPVLVLLSSGETYTDPAATRRAIDEFQQATTVTIDAYHWPLTEKPDAVRGAIENWATGLDAT